MILLISLMISRILSPEGIPQDLTVAVQAIASSPLIQSGQEHYTLDESLGRSQVHTLSPHVVSVFRDPARQGRFQSMLRDLLKSGTRENLPRCR